MTRRMGTLTRILGVAVVAVGIGLLVPAAVGAKPAVTTEPTEPRTTTTRPPPTTTTTTCLTVRCQVANSNAPVLANPGNGTTATTAPGNTTTTGATTTTKPTTATTGATGTTKASGGTTSGGTSATGAQTGTSGAGASATTPTASSDTTTKDDSGSSNTGLIIGIIAVVLIGAGAGYY
ncbi:MAG: hypothetical protein ACHQIG_11815, partial [Acidimicrobiia bacterium]